MSANDLLAPYAHVAGLKSKNLRDAFIDAVNDVVGAPEEHVTSVKLMIMKLHNASLLLDDIEDGTTRRRGQPAAHLIFGTPLTMNAANMVVFEVLGECLEMDKRLAKKAGQQQGTSSSSSAVAVFHEELTLLHHGQGQDIFWRDTNRVPTEDEYREMVERKTGGLFRLAVRLLLLGGENKQHQPPFTASSISEEDSRQELVTRVLKFADHVSFLFQILDDFLNLASADYHEKKTFCEDLTEGKFSFLTTHSVRAAAEKNDTRLLRLLQGRPTEPEVKRFCLALMEQTGTFAYTMDTLDRLLGEARDILGTITRPHASASSPSAVLSSSVVEGADEDAIDDGGDVSSRSPAPSGTPVKRGPAAGLCDTRRLAGFLTTLAAAFPKAGPKIDA